MDKQDNNSIYLDDDSQLQVTPVDSLPDTDEKQAEKIKDAQPAPTDQKKFGKVIFSKPHIIRRKMGAYGALFTLMGWITMMLNPWLSGGCAAFGLILSIIGTCIPRCARRNLAITSIVASAVLLLVLAIFLVGLHFI